MNNNMIVLSVCSFELTSVTPSYKQYLMKLGMPAFIVPFVMSSRESLSITDNGDGSFRTRLVTGKKI